jgi:tetratricopeptide (TPR) repeat protein
LTLLIQGVVVQVWYVENSTEIDKLIDRIRSDARRRTYWMEPLGFDTFQIDGSDEEDNTSTEIDGGFLHSQLLLESLLTMSSSSNEKTSAITYFRTEYADNACVLEKINEFESTYSADRALFWYTQDSFFYRVLNKAFRIQNIDALYSMRVFIRDIRHQLVEQQRSASSSVTQVFRGQLISKLELERFKIGELISMNSFFSTTLERAHATFLLPEESLEGELTSVLFEINIDEYSPSTKPFANITEKSAFPSESEVLFMTGSIFRVTDVDLKIDGISVIKLLLCSDDDHNLKKLFEHMREDIPPECNPLTYGIVLANASKAEQAERFFRNVLKELPADDPLITHVYHQLGNVLDDRGEFQESLEYYEKALAKKLEILSEDSPCVANTYTCCGVAYLRKNELDRALEFYQKALNIYKKAYGDDHQDVAMCLFNIGDVKMFQKKFEESVRMYEQALNIWMRCLPEHHPDIARSHKAIAHVQGELLLGNEALEHYIEALNIMKNSLPPIHHELAALYDDIGTLYYSTGDNQTAQEYFEASLEIKKKLYPSDHQAMADSYHQLGLICKDSGDYQQAVSLLEQALAIQNKFFPPYHEASIRLINDLEEAKTALV